MEKYHMPGCHKVKSHDECRKIVHRLCSSYISSVQEINEDSIKFPLLTQTWSGFKLSWLEPYTDHHNYVYKNSLSKD